jgi:Macrocin-O-methyltransferase (TylF)
MIDTNPNHLRCELESIKSFVSQKNYNLKGDVVEFGTFTGGSTRVLASMFPEKKVFTIDHFEGLEETKKGVPVGSDWIEKAFSIYNPLYKDNHNVPKSLNELKERFEPYPNIQMIVEDVHKLKNPNFYGISEVAICNVDVDIYEPTVSSLEFLTKCVWNEVFIRFDDWHGGESEYNLHERLAFSEWIGKYKYDFVITHGGYIGGVFVKR